MLVIAIILGALMGAATVIILAGLAAGDRADERARRIRVHLESRGHDHDPAL